MILICCILLGICCSVLYISTFLSAGRSSLVTDILCFLPWGIITLFDYVIDLKKRRKKKKEIQSRPTYILAGLIATKMLQNTEASSWEGYAFDTNLKKDGKIVGMCKEGLDLLCEAKEKAAQISAEKEAILKEFRKQRAALELISDFMERNSTYALLAKGQVLSSSSGEIQNPPPHGGSAIVDPNYGTTTSVVNF